MNLVSACNAGCCCCATRIAARSGASGGGFRVASISANTAAYSQSKAARVGSRNSGNANTVTWLITKSVNLETTTEEFLSFETSNSFANGSDLEVLISVDWDGTPSNIMAATWDILPAKIVADGENFKNWVHSTYIDISNYSGTAYIAFRYTGTGNINFDGTFELDNIKINAR